MKPTLRVSQPAVLRNRLRGILTPAPLLHLALAPSPCHQFQLNGLAFFLVRFLDSCISGVIIIFISQAYQIFQCSFDLVSPFSMNSESFPSLSFAFLLNSLHSSVFPRPLSQKTYGFGLRTNNPNLPFQSPPTALACYDLASRFLVLREGVYSCQNLPSGDHKRPGCVLQVFIYVLSYIACKTLKNFNPLLEIRFHYVPSSFSNGVCNDGNGAKRAN